MTLDNFLDKYLGKIKGYPTDKEYFGECLSAVKLYIKECFGINPPPSGTNSAYGYWTNFPNPLGEKFEAVLNLDDTIPKKGWIVIWKPWESNPYGHIAICADGSTLKTLKNYAQNWTSKVFQLESNRYTNVIGYLKPKNVIIDNMTEEQKRILDFIRERKITEGQIRQMADWLKNNVVDNQNKEIDGLEATISDNYKEMDKKNLEYGKLLEEHNILLPKYEELLKVKPKLADGEMTANNLTWQELLKLLINKIFKNDK